jgi:fido (protein-threonine AMPylation protein)
VAGPEWADDDPADANRIVANINVALADANGLAASRASLSAADLRRWHATIYESCAVPSTAYVGRFRGESHPDIVDYEVGVGSRLSDGLPECMGIWARNVPAALGTVFKQLVQAFALLDDLVPAGTTPTEVDVLHEVVGVVAAAHGEWIRIHPFVNGNGRTARLLAAHIALRYGLPVFVTLKPRPHDVAYARAARRSMGRPPLFAGDHAEATAVFTHLLALRLLDLNP